MLYGAQLVEKRVSTFYLKRSIYRNQSNSVLTRPFQGIFKKCCTSIHGRRKRRKRGQGPWILKFGIFLLPFY